MRTDNEMLAYIAKVGFGEIHKAIIERIKKQKAHYRLMKLKRNSGGIAAGTTLRRRLK